MLWATYGNQIGQVVPTSVSFADTSSLSIGWEEAVEYIRGMETHFIRGTIPSVTIPSGAIITLRLLRGDRQRKLFRWYSKYDDANYA